MTKETDPRMHSAEHILTGALVKMYGCGRPLTTHLERRKSKADYAFPRALSDQEVTGIERLVNDVITANAPVREELLSRSEAEKLYDLRRLPDQTGETIRIIHIGDFDACACSGVHVSSTSGIGRFRVVSTSYDGGVLRVRFKLDEAGLEK